jgi:Tfp pilus assembly protein FimT
VVRSRRSGYTLFELGLVMAVLVIISAVSIPVLKPMLTSNHVQAASDLVRSRWTEMRTRAVADGRSYRFSIVEHTGKFRIAPEDDDNSHSDARPWVVEGTLPGNVVFMTSGASAGANHSSHSASNGWTRVVTFLANGTSHEDVHVAFGQDGSASLVLRLRGATGAISAEEGPKS